MKFKPRAQLTQARYLPRVKARYQYSGIAFTHGAHDGSDVCSFFSLAQYNFGKSLAQGTMMIDLCEAKIFKRQMAELRHRLSNAGFAPAYLLKQFYQPVGVHGLRAALPRDRGSFEVIVTAEGTEGNHVARRVHYRNSPTGDATADSGNRYAGSFG